MQETTALARSTFSLSRFIERVRTSTPLEGRAHRVDRLPDGRTTLVFRVMRAASGGTRGDLTIIGPRTRAVLKDASGFVQAIVLDFKPGWSTPLLGVSANALADRYVPLEDMWGRAGRDLCDELLAASSMTDALESIASAFASRIPREPTSAWLARRAVRLLEGDEARVEGVADRLGVTSRHLRRAFAENIGIGPKDFARSVRLQRAVRSAATSPDWARVAAESGYCDQAHLNADFRDLVGLTPTAFMRRTSEKNPPLGPVSRV